MSYRTRRSRFVTTGRSGRLIEMLEDRRLLSAVMVADINAGASSSSPGSLLASNSALLFSATDATHGDELWRSDGTTAGTFLVRDINPTGDSDPISLVKLGGIVLFHADDGVHGAELWRTDGTAAGTFLVKDIDPAGSGYPDYLTQVDGIVYFSADDPVNGVELWRTDGTAAGTFLVKDIWPGSTGSNPYPLFDANGLLVFSANDGTNGRELWVTDGTALGTRMIKDIRPGGGSNPMGFAEINGTVLFGADDGVHGFELWQTDGTPEGTVMVKDINPTGPGLSTEQGVVVNGTLFFAASDGTNGVELWKSDGTAAGTVMVTNINPTGSSDPYDLFNANGTLYFAADDGTHGNEPWRSDGTTAGTTMLRDIDPGASSGIATPYFAQLDGVIFFAATETNHGREVWKTDGTEAGTQFAADISPGSSNSSPRYFTEMNGAMCFTANDGTHGRELWRVTLPSISGNAGAVANTIYSLNLASGEPAGAVAGWQVDWGDGRAETVQGSPAALPHVYMAPGSYRIVATAVTSSAALPAGKTLAVGVFAATATIRGTVFNDLNADGKRQKGEAAIGRKIVYLDLNNNGRRNAGEPSVKADAAGRYEFADIVPGSYFVRAVAPKNWRSSGAKGVLAGAGKVLTRKDVGLTQTGTISGRVFLDRTGDGVLDGFDSALPGWSVFVDLNNNGKRNKGEPKAVTNATGDYLLTLNSGTYTIRASLQPGYTGTTPVGGVFNVVLGKGKSITDRNFGVRK